jgi:hypothetical protein
MKTKFWRFAGALLVAAAAMAAAACGDPPPETPTSIPDAVLTTDTFGGNLTAGGQVYHLVSAKPGEVVLTLTGISDPSVALGMQMGVFSTLSCTAVMDNPKATIGNKMVGLSTSLTNICILVYDPGTITADATVTYEIKVSYFKGL